MNKIKWLVAGVVVAGIAFLATGAFFTVAQTQQAIVLQFGEPKRVIKEPGLAVKIPIIQDVLYYDNRLLDLDPPPFEVLLSDKKRIIIDAYARYRIVDPLAFYRRVATETVLRDRFGVIINSSLRQVVATVSLSDILSEKRDDIMNMIQTVVTNTASSFGVDIVDIRLGQTNLPDETRQSVFDRMRSEREREARELRAEGREGALKIRAKADLERTVLLAAAERQGLILRGEGEAGRTRTLGDAFRKDPAFFDLYKSLGIYRKTFAGGGTTLVLSPDSEFFRFFRSADAPEKFPKAEKRIRPPPG